MREAVAVLAADSSGGDDGDTMVDEVAMATDDTDGGAPGLVSCVDGEPEQDTITAPTDPTVRQ